MPFYFIEIALLCTRCHIEERRFAPIFRKSSFGFFHLICRLFFQQCVKRPERLGCLCIEITKIFGISSVISLDINYTVV